MPQLVQYPSRACLVLGAEDPALRTPVNAAAVIGEALGYGARAIAVPVDNLDPGFFDLSTGFAGELLQKAANYHIAFAVVGDITAYTQRSKAFHDLVVESARATGYCFVPTFDELPARLERMQA